MKALKLGLLATGLLVFSASTVAVTKVVVKEKPVSLMQQGDVWVVPEGTTSNYYSYTSGSDQYICTRTEPTDLSGVKYVTVNVRTGTAMSEIRCYPSSYFDVQ